RTTTTTPCSDPDGQCSIDEFIDSWCSALGVACPEWKVGPCGNENPTPTPSPTPEPTLPGGGPGDPSGGGGIGDQHPAAPCTPFWWVLYQSNDGGQTWHEVNSWYAGCW